MPVDTGLVAAIQDTVNSAFDYKMESINTSIPCIVLAVRDSGAGQMVDIQPTINQKLQDGSIKERPPILGVPIGFQVSSTAGMTFPIKVGDTGLAVFSMRDMDAWKSGNGRPSTPNNTSKMAAGDAVFYPGIQPPGMAVNNPAKHVLTHSTEDTVLFGNLGAVECEVRLKADGSIEINTSNQPVTINCSNATINASESVNINSPQITVDVPDITFIGNITHLGGYTQTGIYTLNGVNVNTHFHPGVQSGPSNTGPMI